MALSPWFTHRKQCHTPVKHDPQRHLVYRMERDFIGTCVFSKTDRKVLEDILTHACRKYKVDRPSLSIIRKPKLRVFGWSEANKITLNESFHGKNIGTLIHELAHHITDHVFGEEDVHVHGREYVAVYMHLLDAYRVMPEEGFRALAERWGVEIDDEVISPYRPLTI